MSTAFALTPLTLDHVFMLIEYKEEEDKCMKKKGNTLVQQEGNTLAQQASVGLGAFGPRKRNKVGPKSDPIKKIKKK